MIAADSSRRPPQDPDLRRRGLQARSGAGGGPAAGAGMDATRALAAHLLGLAFTAALVLGLTGAVALSLRLLL